MKRIVPFILLFGALLLHGNVIHAQKLSLLPLNTSNTQLTNERVTTVESLSNERIQVTTHGLRVRGTISCNSDAECIAAGLDGTEISTRLDWKLNLDAKSIAVPVHVPQGVIGKARGVIIVGATTAPRAKYTFRAAVEGTFLGAELLFTLRMKTRLYGSENGRLVGIYARNVIAHIEKNKDDETYSFTHFEANGQLATFLVDIVPEGSEE